MFVRQDWYVAAWSHEVKTKPLARTLLGEPVVLFRQSTGAVAALLDRCCHRGLPLSFGTVVGDDLECGYHGFVFDDTGRCVGIPGQDKIPAAAKTKSYPVVEQDELVWIWMGDAALADAGKIPEYPYHNDREHWPHKGSRLHIKCNHRLVIDNLLDLSHIAFVHKSTIGGNPSAHAAAEMTVERRENGVRFIRWLLNSQPPPTYTEAVGFKGLVDRWMESEFFAPSCIHQYVGALDAGTGAYDSGLREGGFALRMFHGVTPETADSCHYFWSAANGYRQGEPEVTAALFAEVERTFREDEVILEAQYDNLKRLPGEVLVDSKHDGARMLANRVLDRRIEEEQAAQRRAAESAPA